VIHPFGSKASRDGEDAADGRAGDFSAGLLGQLPRLRRYAIALVGDRAMAEDLLQDCVERALRYRSSLKDAGGMFAWLRTILYNLYMGELRTRRRRGAVVDIDETINSLALSVPPGERTDAMDFVRAMNGLSVDHREILLLVGLEEMSYREIAAVLNIPIGTVMSRLARAREQLRSRLDAQGQPDGRLPASEAPRS
jgi:RNA polymerase sigma-70 factor (ECF subfamily)